MLRALWAVATLALILPTVSQASRVRVATAVVAGKPGSRAGDASSRVVKGLRASVIAVQFRPSTVGETAWDVALAWDAHAEAWGGKYELTLPDKPGSEAASKVKEVPAVLHARVLNVRACSLGVFRCGPTSQYVSARVVACPCVQVANSGTWRSASDPTVSHVWVTFAGRGGGEPLLFVSTALSRSLGRGLTQAHALLRHVRSYLGVPQIPQSTTSVIVAGALYTSTFGELMELFQEEGIGGEIAPPSDPVRGCALGCGSR